MKDCIVMSVQKLTIIRMLPMVAAINTNVFIFEQYIAASARQLQLTYIIITYI